MNDENSNPPADPSRAVGKIVPPPIPVLPVEIDKACIRCSYNLRGLTADGNCPECGTPIEESLRGFILLYAAPEYVQQLRKGLSLILNSVLISIALGILGMGGIVVGAMLMGPKSVPWLQGAFQLIMLVPSALMVLGYWKYAEPDPGYVVQESPHAARRIARASTFVIAAATLVQVPFSFGGYNSQNSMVIVRGGAMTAVAIAAIIVSLVTLIAWAAQLLASMQYTRWIASRIPDEKIMNRSKTYLWLLPVLYIPGSCLLVGPIIALVLYYILLNQVRKHMNVIVAMQAARDGKQGARNPRPEN